MSVWISVHHGPVETDRYVAELEAEQGRWSEKYAALHARFAQQQTKLGQAEAMLRMVWENTDDEPGEPIRTFNQWSDDLRARAEEG